MYIVTMSYLCVFHSSIFACVFPFLVDISATGLRTSLLGPPSPYLRALVKNEDGGLEPSTVAEQRKVDPCSLTANPSWKGVVSVWGDRCEWVGGTSAWRGLQVGGAVKEGRGMRCWLEV